MGHRFIYSWTHPLWEMIAWSTFLNLFSTALGWVVSRIEWCLLIDTTVAWTLARVREPQVIQWFSMLGESFIGNYQVTAFPFSYHFYNALWKMLYGFYLSFGANVLLTNNSINQNIFSLLDIAIFIALVIRVNRAATSRGFERKASVFTRILNYDTSLDTQS